VVAISGASGAVYGVLNTHHELGLDRSSLESLADHAHNPAEIGATIASGSFATQAMVVAPCSMRTLAAVAHGLSDNLLSGRQTSP
jgi:4-hydroxy-3-polyprenylbenzoate decarboxylase